MIRLEKRSQFFAGVITCLCEPMFCNALGHFDALRAKKKIAQKPPCFARFFDLQECVDRSIHAQSDTQNGEIDTRFGTP